MWSYGFLGRYIFTTAYALQGTNTVVDQPLLISNAPTSTAFTESFTQLRDSISLISIKQVRTQRSLDDLKSELLFKIDNLAKAFAEARDQQTQYIQNSIKSVCQESELKAMFWGGGSSHPQPPPDDQSRPSGGSGSRGSGGDGSSQRRDRGFLEEKTFQQQWRCSSQQWTWWTSWTYKTGC
ncbi:hypothetical protein F511_42101 [Dorcoceras hygrometricum]|uniref:Uncharacterized protein n=1 Tax=Dorcoceras hygrometricum TaxID=472368 RepID=A0A2Z7CZ13_9LAMI|nr:hypothetical protein F511_42101 [Dorcoceras hygrometricum]